MKKYDDVIRTTFVVYCIYAVYSTLVVFNRPDNPAYTIFSNGKLPAPVLVFIYFLVPCVAMYFAYRAFWTVRLKFFWTACAFVVPLSYFTMLYFLTDPNWPVGNFLQLQQMISTRTMVVILSLNLAFSMVVALICAFVVFRRPGAIQTGDHGTEYKEAKEALEELQGEEKSHVQKLHTISLEATIKLLKQSSDLLKTLTALIGAITGLASMVLLRHK
jgi:hypothetical protein